MSDQQAFQYQRILTLSPKAFNLLKSKLWEIKAAHPDMPFFFFRKGANEVKIFGHTQTETIKFSFIATAFLRERGIESSEIQMSDPVPIPQGAPMGAANVPLPPVASANNAGWNVAGSQAAAAAAAAVNAPLPPVASANDPGWNVAGSMAAAQHLPNAVYEKMHANMSRAAARRPAMVGGGKRRSARKTKRQSKQSKKERQSRQSKQSRRRA